MLTRYHLFLGLFFLDYFEDSDFFLPVDFLSAIFINFYMSVGFVYSLMLFLSMCFFCFFRSL